VSQEPEIVEFRPATAGERALVLDGLRAHSRANGGVITTDEPFALIARSGDRLVAGLVGSVFWNWLYIDLLWVEPERVRRGLGRRLMREAEERAKAVGLTGLYLWTESWQAPKFYEELGLQRFAEFDDFPPGHKRFGYRKYL
jgi:ribosomal protein S18 acetylase RimI-like enzyme